MTPDAYCALARYNRWMNEKIYAVASTLGDEERKRDRGAFFKSIHGTLNHLLVADRIWLGRLEGMVLEGHRGQVTTLLIQAGRDPGVTDLFAMLREEG